MSGILSPVMSGSGVEVLHGALAQHIDGYKLQRIDPWQALAAPALTYPDGDWDVIHSLPDLGGYGVKPGPPLVVTFHSFSLDPPGLQEATWIQRLFYRKVLSRYVRRAVRRATSVTAVSPFVANLVKEHLGINVEVIANGVDVQHFVPAQGARPDGPLKVLYTGNLSKRKGKPVLFALAEALEDCCEFLVASGLRGGGASNATGVRMLGSIAHDQMPSVYQQADVLFLPTLREGMSLVTLEAMACGLPVLTSNVPAQTYLVDDGEGGYTVPAANIEHYAEKLRLLAASTTMRQSMGEHNREKILRLYRQETMLENYRELFARVASS